MRLLLALLLPLGACVHPDDPPSPEGTENPAVTTTVEVPPAAAASAGPDSAEAAPPPPPER